MVLISKWKAAFSRSQGVRIGLTCYHVSLRHPKKTLSFSTFFLFILMRMLLGLSGLLLVSAAAAEVSSPGNPVHPVNPAPITHIRYQVDGDVQVTAETAAMLSRRTTSSGLRVGAPFSRHLLHRSLVSLYATGQFSHVEVYATEPSENGVSLLFSLTTVLRLADIQTLGVPGDFRRPLENVMRQPGRLQAGSAYHPAAAQRDIAAIKAMCADWGYFGATVTASFSEETRNLTYQLTLGAPTQITDIQIQENVVSEPVGAFSNRAYGQLTTSSEEQGRENVDIDNVDVGLRQGTSKFLSHLSERIATYERTERIATYRKEIYRRTAVEREAAGLQDILRKRGYFAATVHHTFAPETGILQFTVDAGKRLVLNLQATGSPPLDERETSLNLTERIATLRQSPFLWQQRISAYFEEKGYHGTTVDVEETETAIVVWIRPGTRYVVTRVTFSGNRAFSSAELLREMQTKPQSFLARRLRKRFFSQETLTADVARLSLLYRNAGYPGVKIETQLTTSSEDPGRENVPVGAVSNRAYGQMTTSSEDRGRENVVIDNVNDGDTPRHVIAQTPLSERLANDRNIEIHVQVVESAREVIYRCQFEGNRALSVQTLLAALQAVGFSPPQPNARFIRNDYRNAILQAYQARGYMDATVAVSYVAKTEQPMLTFEISEGVPVYFGSFTFTGDAGVREEVLRREFRHLEGKLWTPEALSEAVRHLYNTGIFRRISVSRNAFDEAKGGNGVSLRHPKPTLSVSTFANESVDIDNVDVGLRKGTSSHRTTSPNALRMTKNRRVVVEVEKQKPGSYHAGLGYSTTDGFRTTLALQHRNLYKRNIGASLRGSAGLRAGTLGYLIESSLTKPWLFGRNRGSLAVSERQLEADDNVRALQSRATLSRELSTHQFLACHYNYRFLRQETVQLFLRTTVSSLRLSWRYDSRMPYLNPTTGMLNEVTLEYAGGFLRGQTSFIKTTTDVRFYRELFKSGWFNPTVATALRFGVTHGLRANRGVELISFERFWAGGSTTVRGYAERSLGPLDSAGNHRGDVQFIFNTELRFPLYKLVNGVVFWDTGTVWRSLKTFADGYLEAVWPAAVGIGIRLKWGAFTGGADYAVLVRDIPDATAVPFYLRLGSTF